MATFISERENIAGLRSNSCNWAGAGPRQGSLKRLAEAKPHATVHSLLLPERSLVNHREFMQMLRNRDYSLSLILYSYISIVQVVSGDPDSLLICLGNDANQGRVAMPAQSRGRAACNQCRSRKQKVRRSANKTLTAC